MFVSMNVKLKVTAFLSGISSKSLCAPFKYLLCRKPSFSGVSIPICHSLKQLGQMGTQLSLIAPTLASRMFHEPASLTGL